MSQKSGSAVLVLFGTALLAAGVAIGSLSARVLWQAEEMRGWTRTPATLLACDLNVFHGSKGRVSYRVIARYRYEANGRRYIGDRVSLHAGSDSIGRFQQRLYAELKRCMDRRSPTTCWVNPRNDAEAILVRTPRPEMLAMMQIFVLILGGTGLLLVLTGLAGLLQPPTGAEPSDGHGQIRMLGASAHRVAGAFALAWNGYVAWFLWKVFVVLSPEAMPWYLWLLAATGVVPAVIAGYLIGRIRKFGVSVFEMSPMPGVLGGPVNGTIRIPAPVETEHGFEVVLQCIQQYTTGSGKSRSTRRDVLWEDSRHLDEGLSFGDETMLPVRFAVPYEKPATTVSGNADGFYWRLTATAAAAGIDYRAAFDVPVRHTRQSSPDFVPQRIPDPTACLEPVEDVAAREGLQLEPNLDGGFELVFPAWRPRGSALSLAFVLIAWTALCAALWTVIKAPLFFAVFFTAFDAVLVLVLMNQYVATRGVVVDRARREVVAWMRFPGFARRERHLPFEGVLDVRSERSGQSGDTVFYRVVLLTEGGVPLTVGAGMKMWNDAENLAKLFRASLKPDFTLRGLRV